MALRGLLRSSRAAARIAKASSGGQCVAAERETLFQLPGLLEHSGCRDLFQHHDPASQIRNSSSVAKRVEEARTPLADPKPSVATFQVEVLTGDVRGAGTSAPALLRLVGDAAQSDEFLVGQEEDDDGGFERGSTRSYTFQVGRDLGDLRRLHVQQVDTEDEGNGDSSSAWFLHQINVTTPEGTTWHFPCNSWIGKWHPDGVRCGMGRNLISTEVPHLEKSSRRFLLPEALTVSYGAISLPHPEKIADGGPKAVNRKSVGWGGEDAYFCASGRPGIFGLGVADGVYMWKTKGIDSGLFSRTLMGGALKGLADGMDDVVKLFQAADKKIVEDKVQGSCTACFVIIDTHQGRLTSANLGDSGFLVLAEKQEHDSVMQIKYHSPQQEHQFGFPYQLGHHEKSDSVDDAMLMTLPVSSGDVVVMGSDGLWDNVSVPLVSQTVTEEILRGSRPSLIAQRLTRLAFDAAMDRKGTTPYSEAASEEFDMIYSGGKPDDITVLVTHLL